MKNFLKSLWFHKVIMIVVLFVGFLSCFVFTDFYNNNNAYYQADMQITNIEQFDHQKLKDETFLNEIKQSGYNPNTDTNKYEDIDVSKMIKEDGFNYTINGNSLSIKTGYKYYEEFFLSSNNSVSNRAKTFIKDAMKKLSNENCQITYKDDKNIVSLNGYVNRWIASSICFCVVFVLELIVFSLIYNFKPQWLINEKQEYDNETIFNHCFHKNYWKLACSPLKKVKDITTVAMFFALLVVAGIITLPSGFGNLGLSLAYIFFAIIGMIYGPVYAFVIGIFSDIIGYFTSNTGGAFNFGYTLQAAMCGFIYGICLYKTKVTFSKVLISRTLVNLLMNTIVGSFLFIFVMYFNTGDGFDFAAYIEKVKYYMILMSLPKNVLYLLPQSIVLYLIIQLVNPILVRFKLVDKRLIKHK